jgi:hypothetical protein
VEAAHRHDPARDRTLSVRAVLGKKPGKISTLSIILPDVIAPIGAFTAPGHNTGIATIAVTTPVSDTSGAPVTAKVSWDTEHEPPDREADPARAQGQALGEGRADPARHGDRCRDRGHGQGCLAERPSRSAGPRGTATTRRRMPGSRPGAKAKAFAKARAFALTTNAEHEWAAKLAKLRKGTLVYKVRATDLMKSRPAVLAHTASLTTR